MKWNVVKQGKIVRTFTDLGEAHAFADCAGRGYTVVPA